MKKLLLFLLLFTGLANAQIINIPDPNLKAALLNPIFIDTVSGMFIDSVDTNADGEIELSEALDIRQISLDGFSISDMTGIGAFTNLEGLSCANNQITTANLTQLTALQYVNFTNNQLVYLDASGLNQLQQADITGNPLIQHLDLSGSAAMTSIVLSNYPALSYLDLSNCTSMTSISVTNSPLTTFGFDGCTALDNLSVWNSQLTQMTVQNFASLEVLYIYLNAQLTNLTVANCPALTNLFCEADNISSLQFSGIPNVTQFSCGENQLTTLDLSGLTNLNSIFCAHNLLQALYIKNGHNESSVVFSDNPNLAFICVDEGELATVQTQANTDGMTNVAIDSYCTFTPGGNYNTITGIAHFDADNNGCDNGDITPNNIRVNITDGSNTGASFLNNSGNYSFYTQAGNFTITPSVENPTFFNFSPASAAIPFANNNNNVTTQNFCISANGVHHDVEMVISPVIPARPGFDAVYKLVYKNKGNQTENVFLNFNYDDSRLDYVTSSIAPFLSSSGAIMFNINNVHPFENGSVTITMHVNAPTDSPAVNVGDVLNFTSFIDLTTDENWADNNFTFNQTVIGSFDPNDITCLEGNVVASSEIGNYLHYAINFENTGTDAAENIVVKMQVDPAQFDLNSMQLMNASHPVAAKITGNIVEFVFQNIDLNIGGHGHILLKMKSNSTLAVGSIVSRRADIFFDYNLPVDTGSANTTFQVLKTQDFQTDSAVVFFPNPTKGMLTVRSLHTIKSVAVYDMQGRILTLRTIADTESKIDLSNYPKGIYFVKVATDSGSKTEKVIRE